MNKYLNIYSGLIFKAGIVAVILAAFFLFTNLFSDLYDTPKFLVLIIFTALMLIVLTLKFTVSGKVVFLRTSLDIPLLLLLAVAIVSTVLSPSPYVSLFGDQLKVHTSLIAIITYVLFYFVLTNALKGAKEVKWIFNIGVIAAQVLAAVSLLTYAGVKVLPSPWSHGLNFTTTGSSFSTTAVLAMLLPFVVFGILRSSKPLFIILNSLFLLISGAAIALTGPVSIWIAAGAGLLLTLIVSNLSHLRNLSPVRLISLAVPLVLIILITILSLIPPIGKAQNPVYTQAQNFPREVQLNPVASWKISVSAFRDLPFWGTGPSTYLFNFTNYKPIEFNSSKFWNVRFDNAYNEYLQVLATLGGIGVIALLSLTALFVSAAYKTLKTDRFTSEVSHSSQQANTSHVPLRGNEVGLRSALAIAGIVFFIILFLHVSTLPLWILGTLVLASFMVTGGTQNLQRNWGSASGDFKEMFLRIAANVTSRNPSEETIKADALPGILLVIVLALVIFASFFGSKVVLADYHRRVALNAVAQNNGILAYNELIAAEKLNPKNDLYRLDLAQVNFALANAIAAAKGPTEASPGGSLTDADKQNIQVLLSQSISEGRNAVALNPRSATNWEVLAVLYRQISGVAQNALVFSLDAYGRAIFQDPLNPNLRLAAGGVYYSAQNYDMAIRFFGDAVNLKPDFANGYLNLSVALKDKGDLAGAQAAAEQVLTLIEKDSPDYKAVTDYLNDLKSKAESEAQPPAARETEALQQDNLPKVVNVGNPPEDIATPSAVKKPNSTPEPTPPANP